MDAPFPSLADSADPQGEFPIAPPEYLFLLLTAITRYRDSQLERLLRPLKLTLSKHRALLVIERFQPCTMSELADFSVVERTTMTRTVDLLVADGLVERMEGPADRRQVLLSLNAAGRAKLGAASRLILDRNRLDLEGMPEADQRALVRLSQALAANLAPDAISRERVLTFNRPKSARADGSQ